MRFEGVTFSVVPETVKVVDDKGRSISNGSKLQPAPEGTQVSLTCQAIGGKPIPRVSWYKKGEKLKGNLVATKQKCLQKTTDEAVYFFMNNRSS